MICVGGPDCGCAECVGPATPRAPALADSWSESPTPPTPISADHDAAPFEPDLPVTEEGEQLWGVEEPIPGGWDRVIRAPDRSPVVAAPVYDAAALAEKRRKDREDRRKAYAGESDVVRAARYAEWLSRDERLRAAGQEVTHSADFMWEQCYADLPVPQAIVEMAAARLAGRR